MIRNHVLRLAVRVRTRTQLFVLLAGTLFMGLAASYWVSSNVEEDALQQVRAYVEEVSRAVEVSVLQLRGRGSEADLARLQSLLRADGVQRVTVRDAEGQILAIAPVDEAETPDDAIDYRVPIMDGNRIVGYLDIRLAVASLQTLFRGMLLSKAAVSLVIFSLGLLIAFPLTRSVTRPYAELEQLAAAVAEGDLSPTFPLAANLETAGVFRSFGRMLETLRRHRDREAQIARTEREAAVGRMAAGIAHDIRNPLNYVQLAVGQLRLKSPSAVEEGSELYDGILEELSRMDRITRDLLSFGRPMIPHLAVVDAYEVLGSAIRAVVRNDPERESDIAMDDSAEPGLCVTADRGLLERALVNVLQNALDATDPGMPLGVGAGEAGDSVAIWIEDSGPGLPFADPDEAFRPYVSAKPSGVGLGLALASRWVSDMHGTIDASTPADGGTRIEIRLPRAEEDSVEL